MADEFELNYEPDAIIAGQVAECDACKKAKQKDFEFRIRRAYGEVQLVGPEAAFCTLENCRQEIEEMRE